MDHKDIQEFIYFLYHNKSLTRAQQIKRDTLLARDFATKDKTSNNDIHSPKGSDIDSPVEDNKSHREGITEEYIPPKNLQQFLRKYNQNNILKYTCHLIDDDEVIDDINKACKTKEYKYTEHLKKIKSAFSNLRWEFKEQGMRLPSNMITLISVYLFGKGLNNKETGKKLSWSTNDIKLNWSSEELLNWSEENPNMVLNPGINIAAKQASLGYRLPRAFISLINGNRVQKFSDLVLFFKSQFHIREDNSLRMILDNVNSNWKEEEIQVSYKEGYFFEAIELFTDVDKLIQAYKKIIKICFEKRRSMDIPIQIEISFYEDNGNKYFCVHHKNNQYGRTSGSATRMGESQTKLVKNQINGLCDLYVEAVFADEKFGRLNLWDEEKELKFEQIQENPNGVKYILKF